jgi:hypothetical protein
MAPGVKINSMKFRGLPAEKLISQINPQRDSLELWVNDQRKMPDTLQLLINYDKTDTLGNLVPTDEVVKLALDKKMRAELQKSSQRDVKHQDTIAVFKGEVDPTTVEQYGFTVEFQYPLIKEAWDSLVFRSVNPRQQEKIEKYTVKKERVGLRTAYLTFMAPGAKVNSLKFKGLPKEKLISQFNPQQDSLELWVNDQRKMPDTLFLQINYDKTDTLGKLVPTDEEVKLALDKKLRAELQKSSQRDVKHQDTIAVFKGEVDPTTVEQYGFTVEFQYPLILEAWDSLTFRSVNPRQQEKMEKY